MTLGLLAQAVPNDSGWHPFLTPMPVWGYWFWLVLPLALGVAVAYKTTKCSDVRAVPREAALLTLWIVGGLLAAAAGVAVMAHFG